ncbi:Hypothetical protein CAP_7105 [Chondromyces apiculatus DSM 436]|uniref:Uncharacterized protein n=1 Tax=Chondromyces apiculatus DSM 436 TaxID=1192034 RepID=A0A017SZT6_9BACT|nr:Hypothetical protein CAP_7105 [Chondromyces apiculatus DSM 436]
MGLIVGLGCGGIVLIGIIVSVVLFFKAKSAAEEILNSPEMKSLGDPGIGAPSDGSLKAELRDLRSFKGSLGGSRYFVGEIHNTGTANIGFPMAKVTLYDASNTAVESGTCMSVVRALSPGEKVPCTFMVTGNKTWKSEKVEITPQRAFLTGEVAKLDITDVKFTPKKQAYSAHDISGKVTNQSSFLAKNVMVIVSLYDKAGKIVGATQAPVAGNNLATATSARFEAKIFDVAETPDRWQVIAVGYSE